MTDLYREPRFSVFPAALAATFAPATLGALAALIVEPSADGTVLAAMVFHFGMMIAALHVFILGVPLYLLLRRRGPVRWTTVAAAGLVIGALPAAIVGGPGADGGDILLVASAALLGLSGALAFSWTLKRLA
jgi:hypothetical protein